MNYSGIDLHSNNSADRFHERPRFVFVIDFLVPIRRA
jgi:hypothetical protein